MLTFERKHFEHPPDWSNQNVQFNEIPVRIESSGSIENANGLRQAIFANRVIGGSILWEGCLQEEIRMTVSPELIVCRVFVEHMEDNECVVVKGAAQFNSYQGYDNKFRHRSLDASTIDPPFDASWRRSTCVVFMDAHKFTRAPLQFEQRFIDRELNKLFVSFGGEISPAQPVPGVATGNWGCGSFGGNKDLKALIQLMVAAATKRPLVYYTFGDVEQCEKLATMVEYMTENQMTIGQVYRYLNSYRSAIETNGDLFEFIMNSNMDRM